MNDNSIQNNMVNVTLPDFPESVDNAIKNLTNEPSKNIGKTFADAWFLVFGSISQKAEMRRIKYAQDLKCYQEEISEAIDKIPNNDRIEPSIQVTAQALENSKYCISSKELRKLFVNLISGSMNSQYESCVHPSFAEIIKQMSPYDAKILKIFPINGLVPTVDYVREKLQAPSYQTELANIVIPESNYDIFKVSISVSSLERLGLISLNKGSSLVEENAYDVFLKTSFYKEFSNKVKRDFPDEQAAIQKYVAFLTPLGKNFVHVCVNP